MVVSFEFAIMFKIRKVEDLRESDGEIWKALMQALKEEFFMEDLERITKRIFLE